MQLLNWLFNCKINYWMKAIRLPRKKLALIKSMTYRFIWDGRMGVEWNLMT